MTPPIRGVLLDLSGTLHIGPKAIDGAVEAVQRLRKAGVVRLRFLTNTSKVSGRHLLEQLRELGFDDIHESDLWTSVGATRAYLLKHNLRPYCLMEDTSDLRDVPLEPPHDCVVVGLAPSKFDYSHLNKAFQILQESPKLIAIHRANYFRDSKGKLSLGPGGFVTGLENAARLPLSNTVVMGKPSRQFFQSAVWEDFDPDQVCMVGDDVQQDVEGALDAGLGMGILVQTGKYQTGDDDKLVSTERAVCVPSIVEAVESILKNSDAAEK